MTKRLLKITACLVLMIFIGGGVFYIVTWYGFQEEREDAVFGVNFSTVMARQLGLEPREIFDAVVEDLGARKIRLPVYWSDVEKEKGEFGFGDYDYFVKMAEERGVKLILAVGQKLPRWPECHEPEWVKNLGPRIQNLALTNYISTVVERYKNSPAVEAWQVENEPFHIYGAGCAKVKIKAGNVDKEIALVRALDSRPIMLTDSGEQGWWYSSLTRADTLGISMYFQVWNNFLKEVRFPFGPGFYSLKKSLFRLFSPDKKIIVSELEMEPWGPSLLPGYDLQFQKKLMNAERFSKNISFARRSGFDTFYLWGVEWWYWLNEKQNDSSLWKEAMKLFGP